MESKAFSSTLLLLLLIISGGHSEVIVNIENQCSYTLWLAASPSDGDFNTEHAPGTLEIFTMPDPWTGSIWARTKCSNNASFYFSCETGDCGSGKVDCQGPQPKYPVTLLNLSINQSVVSYEVSLNHGFNIPVSFRPDGGSLTDQSGSSCPVADCTADLSNVCSPDLVATNKDGAYVACYSACDALKDPKFCCTEQFSGQACQPNQYSQAFKKLCGLAHTYPGDSNPPTYACKGATRYNITYCPI